MAGRGAPGASREYSCGGVVVRDGPQGPECVVIVPSRRAAGGRTVLALPKGHPEGDEPPAEAALREVREETGIEAQVEEELGEVAYWYQRDGRRIRKVVTFFLLRHVAGDPERHEDHEIDRARWMGLDEAARTLSYAGERGMVERAAARLRGER